MLDIVFLNDFDVSFPSSLFADLFECRDTFVRVVDDDVCRARFFLSCGGSGSWLSAVLVSIFDETSLLDECLKRKFRTFLSWEIRVLQSSVGFW